MSSNAELKAYSNTISDQSRHLRREARKAKKKWENARVRGLDTQFKYLELFQDLSNFRKSKVKNTARATYLARAFIEGRKYKSVETKRSDDHLFYNHILPVVTDIINESMDESMYDSAGWVTYDEVKAWVDAPTVKSFWSKFKFW